MAYNDYQMGGYIPGDYETEEERRRRLEQEQAQALAANAPDNIDIGGGFNPAAGPDRGGFMDVAGRYVDNRIGAAQQRVADVGQMFEDPEAALQRRMGLAVAPQPDLANTEVQSQQVKTYADGSQEEIVKRQMPAGVPVAPTATGYGGSTPEDLALFQAQAPQLMQDPQAQARQAAAVARMQAAKAATQPLPEAAPAPAVPQDLVAGGGVTARPDIGQVPTPGPAVQVAQAGPVNPAAPVVQQAPAAAPGASLAQVGQAVTAQPARPQWAVDLEAAGTDQDKLIDIAANKTYPQDVRDDAKAKLRLAQDKDIAAKDAEKTVTAAAQGDPRAQQKLLNSIKPGAVKREEEGRVTEGSYIRAYLYARLGLTDLAQEEQQKILGKSKFGQVIVNGQSFEVETDPRSGRVLLARDAEGNKVDTPILNQIRAEAAKFGTSAFGFTGEAAVIPAGQPDAGQEYRQRTNAITGKIENIITTGPNANKVYTGTPGQRVSVGTAAAKTDYNLAADLYKKHSGNVIDMLKEYEMIRGPMTDEGRGQFLRQYGYGGTIPAPGGAVARPGAPAAAPQAPQAAPVQPGAQPAPAGPAVTRPGAAPVAQTQPVQTQPAPAMAGTGGRVGGGVSTGGIAGMKVQQDIGKAGAIENIQVQGARSKAFNDILDTEVRPQAQAGDTVSGVRKQQFAIFDRPGVDANKLFGLYNAAAEGTGDQKLSIIRDIFGGVFKPDAEVSQRLAALNLTPQEKSALMEYNTANQRVNAATLKQNAGPGAVSDAEQRANREANVDITKVPALGAFNAMAQSQFDGDRARWKADWALTQPAQNALQLDKAWRKENQRLGEMYRETATQRARFIAENGGTTAAVQLGYKRFPVPEYDPATETWKKTRPIGSYDR
jgi:hypothetical protein